MEIGSQTTRNKAIISNFQQRAPLVAMRSITRKYEKFLPFIPDTQTNDIRISLRVRYSLQYF